MSWDAPPAEAPGLAQDLDGRAAIAIAGLVADLVETARSGPSVRGSSPTRAGRRASS